LTASWNYDDFGRRTRETGPDGTSTWWTYSACSGSCDSRIKLQLLREEKDAASQVIRADTDCIDRWDRLIWQKTQLLTGNDTARSIRRQFDARGALVRDYAPSLATGTDNGYRQIACDAIGRPGVEALSRAGGVLDRATNYAYAGLAITQTDPLNHATTRTMSAWGPLARVTDADQITQPQIARGNRRLKSAPIARKARVLWIGAFDDTSEELPRQAEDGCGGERRRHEEIGRECVRECAELRRGSGGSCVEVQHGEDADGCKRDQ